jgi:hypothetical protein
MHRLAEVHATALRPAYRPPTGFTVRCTYHLAPWERSASVWTPSTEFVKEPTAVHALAVGHDTAVSPEGYLGVPGFGLAVTVQLLPSQDSIRFVFVSTPTATHRLVDEHETLESPIYPAAGGVGIVRTDQLVPFHRAEKSVKPGTPVREVIPRTTQLDTATHDA